MELAKILSDGTVDLRCCTSKESDRYKKLLQDGFLEFVSEKPPQIKTGQIATNTFSVVEGKVIQKWAVKENSVTIIDEIESLKRELLETDYMVIKCYESSLIGEELPYDISSLHASRQKIRDQINFLQKTINA